MSALDSIVTAAIVGGLASAALAALGQVGVPPLKEDGPVGRPEALARARALRAAHDRRLGTTLITLGVLIWPVGIILSAAAQASGIGTGIILPPLMVTSAVLIMRGRRMRAKNAERVLEGDPRPPIVYLRPFDVDRVNREVIAPDSFRGKTAEQVMERAFRDVAPFVALGDPTEELPELGAVRLYADDAEWQEKIKDLTKRAGTIILYAAGDSDGLAWEVQHVVSLERPERIVLVRGRINDYDLFFNTFAHLFPRGLLKNVDAASRYLYFDADWTPHSFDENSNVETLSGSPGEQRDQVLFRLLKGRL
jgi:hypothetical protein